LARNHQVYNGVATNRACSADVGALGVRAARLIGITRALDFLLRVNNAFDRRYATAGFLTSNGFNANGSFRPDPDEWTERTQHSAGSDGETDVLRCAQPSRTACPWAKAVQTP